MQTNVAAVEKASGSCKRLRRTFLLEKDSINLAEAYLSELEESKGRCTVFGENATQYGINLGVVAAVAESKQQRAQNCNNGTEKIR